MLESSVQTRIRLAAAHAGLTLFRNNSGACTDDTGRLIRYGLGNDSAKINAVLKSSDLIGWQTVTVTPDMLGRKLAVFCAVEAKHSDWSLLKTLDERERAQKAFIDLVIAGGGKAGFVNDPSQLYRIMAL